MYGAGSSTSSCSGKTPNGAPTDATVESAERYERQPLLGVDVSNEKSAHFGSGAKIGPLERRQRMKALKEYYRRQDDFLRVCAEDAEQACGDLHAARRLDEACGAAEYRARRFDKWLASAIFIWNLVMLAGNLAASILSGSYSVISAFIDSSMDIMSSVIVFLTIWAINNTNMFNYPRGRQRLEIVAVIVCSVFMGVTNLMMIVQSVEAIVNDTALELLIGRLQVNPDANAPTMLILIVNIGVKCVFMVVCYRHDTTNSRVLALDQRNDVITSVVAMAGAYIGDHYYRYADPIGAILVCSFVAGSWFSNAFSNVPLIVGRRAEQEHVSRILRLAVNHDDRIRCLDHILCYHVGERALVELHIVLDEQLPLKITHDITEALQRKIQSLDFVERVFVHVDYRCDGHEDGC